MRLRSTAVIAANLLFAAQSCPAQDVIHVAYSERPPYMITQADGTPAGLTGAPAAAAFRNAHIPVQWHKVPTNRQLMMVKDQTSPSCAIGWFNTPERRQYGKFTKPIYRDRTWVVLTNASFAARGVASLAELAQLHDTRVLVKDNYSFGELDAFIAHWQPVVAVSTAPTLKMVQSVSKGVVDMMFVSEDEGNYIIQHAGELAPTLRLLQFKDMPHGAERYIMCGKSVSDEVIARLNKAITFK
ncbi:transporter substrate-binding domain-containing protein [Pseudoduganella sp. FT25W]|uniref:Transporter substrate-binding domain-containing protein n=1 Tax=Duganella alba TaxID=2666081 RepID=A0A6L5QH52_9BURK|nr:transporter substrate-binding domain-containing protein [Duganella alba]MRX09066.1 transporter substrate-binding domain-containing protein [Duganella alba]MRX15657.1 transporter substrate-binding domain-containing protein [Duganella alba]